jgi:diaminohydroxyphosphoribosylaminopyrimidine deaminase / 5-amino-6-(5-phosphoribosylamino)uracil reductase
VRQDDAFMREAFAEARKRFGRTGPNPAVGAVFVRDGQVLARGHHVGWGLPHAEVALLAECREKGIDVSKGIVYVSLEPCNHEGRTGACARALLDAGVKEVVYGCRDPNPRVEGMELRPSKPRVCVSGERCSKPKHRL